MNNTPNPAIDAQPGWRGTDPDGGTWVRCPHGLPGQWAHFTADGKLVFRSQEEAEAAGLEALQAESAWDLRHEVEAWLLAEARWKLAESQDAVRYWRGLWEAEKDRAAAAPAPLDPGNPEHLRQVARVLNHFTSFAHRLGDVEGQRAAVMLLHLIRSEADRLDREQREAEQDAADRKRAEEYARTEAEGEHRALGGWSAMRADIREWHIRLALRVIRDERARASN
ncbi:hypothetical protein [Tsukamurella pseudospumae]|nr:hypothetical protein [Tsukamurella pseudospumae]